MIACQVLFVLSAFLLHHISYGEEQDKVIMMEIERKTLGKHPVLGQLYTAHSDHLLHGFSFWYQEEIEAKKIKIWHPWQDTSIQKEHTIEDELELLDVEAQLSASFKAGLVKVTGSAAYLNREESFGEKASVIFTYQSRSRTESISPSLTQNISINVCHEDNPVNRLSQKYVPTHVVSAITYGGDVHFVYSQEGNTDKELMDIYGALSVEINAKVTTIKGAAALNYTVSEDDINNKLHVEMFSDFIVDEQPTSINESIEIYKKVATNFGSKESMYENSVPMSMELMPIVAFCPQGGLAAEISDSIVNMAANIRLTLKGVLKTIEKLLESTAASRNVNVRKLLLDFKSEVSSYTINYERTLQRNIVDARNPGSRFNETAIVELINSYKNSKFDYDKYIYPYLTERTRQVNAINIFYDETLYQNEPQIADYSNADIPRAIITSPNLFLLTLYILPNVAAEKYETYTSTSGENSKCLWFNNKTKVGEIGELWRDYINFFSYNNYKVGSSFFVETREGWKCGESVSDDVNSDVVDISFYENGRDLDVNQEEFKNLVQTAPTVSACRDSIVNASRVEFGFPTFNQNSSLEIENVLVQLIQSTSRSSKLYPTEIREIKETVLGGFFRISDLNALYSYNISMAFSSKYGSGKPSKVIKLDGDFDKMMKTPGCIIENNVKFNDLKQPGIKSTVLECAEKSEGYWSYEIGSSRCYEIHGDTSATTATAGWASGSGCRSSSLDLVGICPNDCLNPDSASINYNDYRGSVSTTAYGDKCEKWTWDNNTSYELKKYPGFGLGDHNYCRNPDGEDTPWCYFKDLQWDKCDIPICPHECLNPDSASIKYNDYRGSVSTTENGDKCVKWTDQHINQEKNPGFGLGDHNYCRNPDGEDKPWCYKDKEGSWNKCEIPICI